LADLSSAGAKAPRGKFLFTFDIREHRLGEQHIAPRRIRPLKIVHVFWNHRLPPTMRAKPCRAKPCRAKRCLARHCLAPRGLVDAS
jgi:hypothetical protein